MEKLNYGILASISWNSRKWAGSATDEDLKNSNYGWVKKNHRMMEDLNFGYDQYPSESDGTFIAYTPMFNRMPSLTESKYVEIIFFRSLNYHSNENLVVGLYAFPTISNVVRKADNTLYKSYVDGGISGNVRSKKEDIVLFNNPVIISESIAKNYQFLPEGKKLGQQGFNYLHYENVMRILDRATNLNQFDSKLKNIKFRILKEITVH
ncbi:MAG: hypothetical protein ACM3N1_00185 [Accumulibacter sp.]